ncbi:hypothetical protein ACKKBF_B01840 [Auxenochlorella protothecoides x Auxenochlorella symbiontica]
MSTGPDPSAADAPAIAEAVQGPNVDGVETPYKQERSPFARKVATAYYYLARPQEEETRINAAVIILAAVVYGVLYFAIGSVFLPGHAAWCTLLLWVASNIGAFVAFQLRLPRVIGMLCAGLLMQNLPWSAVDAFPPRWGTQMRAAALATIFLRCGLELDLGTMRRYKYPAIRLALIPGLVEALYDGALATAPALFGMPILLGFTMGFILKAVGPGLVVPAMFKLQKTGLGKDQGIPSTIVISASFDDIVAITGFAIFSHIAITGGPESGNLGWEIAQGPVQVVFGILGGLLGGFIIGCTRIFYSRLIRLVAIYGGALLIMFFLEYYGMLSGGALGSLTIGLATANFWERGLPRCGSLGPSFTFSTEVERFLEVIWSWVMEPMLFVTIGASINFQTLSSGTIPKSLVIICTGVILRMIVTFFAMSRGGYTTKEKIFFALAWTPKATVQAALSATPLAMIQAAKAGQPDYAQWEQWGYDILTTGIFAIIICATLGVLAIHLTAHRFLEMPEESDEGRPQPSHPSGAASNVALHRSLSTMTKRRGTEGGLNQSASAEERQVGYEDDHTLLHHNIALEDYEVVALYIDAISELSTLVASGKPDEEELQRLSHHVAMMKRRVEQEVGQREVTVRELFRSASLLAANKPVVYRNASRAPQPPSLPASPGKGSHNGDAAV